jgi:phosphoglycolate phosphatase
MMSRMQWGTGGRQPPVPCTVFAHLTLPVHTHGMPAIQAIILDFDDTLFMTEQASFEMENEAARRVGHATMSRETHLANWGMPIEEAIQKRLPGIDVPRFLDAHADIIAEYAATGRLDALSESNLAALTALVQSGYKLYAVTSRHEGEVKHFLDGQHILQRYMKADAIYYRNRVKYRKPDPRVFDEVLAASGLPAAACVYVGDSESDCRAAKGAGIWFVCCLESGLRRRQDFAQLPEPPDAFIDTFAELPHWLKSQAS